MKRFIYMFITICLLFSVMISFADEKTTYSKQKDNLKYKSEERKSKVKDRNEAKEKVKNREDIKKKIKNRAQNLSEVKEGIKTDIKQVSENKKKISELVKQSKESYKEAKKHVKMLMKQKDSLTDKQVEMLKNSLVLLKSSNTKIRNSKGDFEIITKKLKDARKERDFKTAKECYKKIIEIQNSRIENLNKFIKNINSITEI